MSQRNIRKLFGGNTLPAYEGSSDEEYEPHSNPRSAPRFTFEGLGMSSHSESEHESTDAAGGIQNEMPETKKNKRKKKHQKHKTKSISKENLEELDEIDRSIREVNALLGEPAPAPSEAERPAPDPRQHVLAVQAKHLDSRNEKMKLFGADKENKRRGGHSPHMNSMLRKAVIVPVTDTHRFRKVGLSMSILRSEDDCIYFGFDHNKAYQRMHKELLLVETYHPGNSDMMLQNVQKNLHVEEMLESVDLLYRVEMYSVANSLLEQVISYMHYVAHPSFNLADCKVRLEYKYVENRAFHIAVMKYMYLISNWGCHRTALEIAKLLLNLDPSDPLAVLFVIDTFALRAREYQWLIDAIDYWSKERDAGFLFNMQYSKAMAQFHVAFQKKEDLSEADALLQAAMLRFPNVVLYLLQTQGFTASARIKDCALFATADDVTGQELKELLALYVKLSWSRWREKEVLEWFKRNAEQLADKYDQDDATRERAKDLANERLNIFRGWPQQVVRHISIISPMAGVLIDGSVPFVPRFRSADPAPPADGISRFGYDKVQPASATAATESGTSRRALLELFSSMLPFREEQLQNMDVEDVGQALEDIRAQLEALPELPLEPHPDLPLEPLPDFSLQASEHQIEAVLRPQLQARLAPRFQIRSVLPTEALESSRQLHGQHHTPGQAASASYHNTLSQVQNTPVSCYNTSDQEQDTPTQVLDASDIEYNTPDQKQDVPVSLYITQDQEQDASDSTCTTPSQVQHALVSVCNTPFQVHDDLVIYNSTPFQAQNTSDYNTSSQLDTSISIFTTSSQGHDASVSDCNTTDQKQNTSISNCTTSSQGQDASVSDCNTTGQVKDTSIINCTTSSQGQDASVSDCNTTGQVKDTSIINCTTSSQGQDASVSDCNTSGQVKDTSIINCTTSSQGQDASVSDCNTTGQVQDTSIINCTSSSQGQDASDTDCNMTGQVQDTSIINCTTSSQGQDTSVSDCSTTGQLQDTSIINCTTSGQGQDASVSDCITTDQLD